MLGVKMCAKKKEEESEPASESEGLEEFVSQYLDAYRGYLGEKDMDERHMPQFYKGFPFVAEIYRLPNEAVCVLFRKSNRSKILVIDGDYSEVKEKLDERALDFMQVFPPYTSFDSKEAERLAHLDAERDLKASRRLEILSATETHMEEIHDDMKGMLDLNPWLDDQAKTQKEKLDRAKELIIELYKALDLGEEERFADYARSFMEIMAFERAEVEAVAGEVEVEMESVLQEIEDRTAKIEESFETFGKAMNANMSELEETVKEMKKEFEAGDGRESGFDELEKSLKDVMLKVEGLEKDIKTDELEKSLKDIKLKVESLEKEGKTDELEQSLKEMKLKVEALEEGEGMSDGLELALTKVRGSLKDTKSEMTEIRKELSTLKKDLIVTKEIKDTVFRDNKRMHNINNRVSDIEKNIRALTQGADKEMKAQIKALEGKMNVMKKDINDQVKDAVEKEVARSVASIKMEPPPPADLPTGATVKKTTKKKTTKKTRKKS
jgi:DNA repair exonuclease SbcCD ATPase subunit